MNMQKREEVNSLLTITGWPCISIYMPVNKKEFDTRDNPVRLKNLVSEAKETLKQRDPDNNYDHLFEPVERIYQESKHPKNYGQTLAIFIAQDFYKTYNLPVKLPQSSLVEKRFNIKPLLPLILDNKQFYLLCFSQKEIKLYNCDYYNIKQIPLKDTPKSVDELMSLTEFEKHTQLHTMPAGKSKGTDARFHGQGTVGDKKVKKQKVLHEFTQMVDNALQKAISGTYKPLVLAGSENICDYFKNHSGYNPIFDEVIREKTEIIDEKQLHQKAVNKVHDWLDREKTQKIQSFPAANENNRASTDIKEIVPAAKNGKISDIFINSSKSVFGKYDEDKEGVFVGDECNENETEELVNLAAVLSYISSANIYEIPADSETELEDKAAACIFRY